MMRRPVSLVVLFLVLVACGPSARQRTLQTMFTGATAAQAGFVAWDTDKLDTIASSATTVDAGLAEIAAYKVAREPVVKAFEGVYQAIAAAALLNDDEPSLVSAVSAFEQLRAALRTLTGGRLP